MPARITTLALGLLFMGITSTGLAADPEAGKQVPRESTVAKPVQMRYWLYLPEGYDKTEKYPLVLFLHGRGERGDNLEAVLKHGPPKLAREGKQFPFILVAPQLSNAHLFWQTNELLALLDHIEETHAVDTNRVYCTGLSMGGYGTWALGVAAPKRFAALLPICGAGDPSMGQVLKDIPIWVFHGTDDRAVPFAQSEAMVKAIKGAGGDPRFTIYQNVGHDSWTETYNNPAVYEWMLEQKLKP